MRTLHFKNKKNYLAYLAFGQATGVFERTPGHSKIYIAGKSYKPKHSRGK